MEFYTRCNDECEGAASVALDVVTFLLTYPYATAGKKVMPGYKTHDKVGFVATVPIAGAALYFGLNVQDTVTLAIGIVVSTYYLSPDLDIHSRIFNRWGLLRWIWIPYQKVMHHRSWLSHSGPISATLRLMYLFAWIAPILYYFGFSTDDLQYRSFYAMLWIALMIADTLHVMMDLIWKE